MAEGCNADWMGSLAPALSAFPLAHLAIPGSHDSFSYWVDEKSPVGPDQATAIKRLAKISLVKKLMKKWSVTQNLTFKEQLEAGIRYFDLRVSSKPGEVEQEIYFIHGLFGIKVWDGLMEINTFLTEHPKEAIFLDFNHFYAMEDQHHIYLINRIREAFGSKLCTMEYVENVTLRYLWEKSQQVGKGHVMNLSPKHYNSNYKECLIRVQSILLLFILFFVVRWHLGVRALLFRNSQICNKDTNLHM
uniref:Phosphatidylinositol-specific phospholipase C X domain-containing protein n=1 Tax=Gopherus agassizii TaxID=38772 RepID=A0A452GM51_9SAUR